jgi:hypothetical protein
VRVGSGGLSGIGCFVDGLRVPWQQFVQAGLGDFGDACEDVSEPCLGIDTVELGGEDEGIDGGGPVRSTIGACEQPGFSAKGQTAQTSLGCVVGQADPATARRKRLPADHVLFLI